MKIVFVQAGLGAGGAEKIVNMLANHYAERGHHVTVLALAGPVEHSFFAYDPAVAVETFHDSNAPNRGLSGRLANIRWLRNRFRDIRPDLVVSFLTKVNLFASIAARSAGVPIIASERNNPGMQFGGSPWRFANLFTGMLANRMVMQTTQAVHSLSASARHRATVIANPCTNWGPVAQSADKAPAFVATGRLEKQKGFDLLLQAFATVAAETPEATLSIFGEGQEQQNLAELIARLGLDGRAHLAGKTGQPGDWIRQGNVFVLSSRFEGFPNVLVEAMFAGFAVVAFDCAWGPADIVTNRVNGLLVDDGDVAQLAAAMGELATDGQLRAQLSAAGPQAVAHLTSEQVLAQWDAVIGAYEPLSTSGVRT